MVPQCGEEDHRHENVHHQEAVVEPGTQWSGREANDEGKEDQSHDSHDPPLKVLVDIFVSRQAALDELVFGEHTSMNHNLKKGDAGDPAVKLVEGRKTPPRDQDEGVIPHAEEPDYSEIRNGHIGTPAGDEREYLCLIALLLEADIDPAPGVWLDRYRAEDEAQNEERDYDEGFQPRGNRLRPPGVQGRYAEVCPDRPEDA